ncbi:hypothetical protein SLEP1_g37859 [Rubroshorea leprosula]|uniref:Uncharacterized protein n=1 Tax=Rubroshorea leprosula TaxID=152421 RepID=A0AAV5KW40_9ROSI|nr:hypothetical protein SLEP1_g37859 [Rubroshorea leprosula]
MELSLSSIQTLVKDIEEEMFLNIDSYSFVSPSAYDTAWLAMVRDPQEPEGAWIGYWGECDGHGMPTIESLPATLACVVALKKWNVGTKEVERAIPPLPCAPDVAFLFRNLYLVKAEDGCKLASIVNSIGLEAFVKDAMDCSITFKLCLVFSISCASFSICDATDKTPNVALFAVLLEFALVEENCLFLRYFPDFEDL